MTNPGRAHYGKLSQTHCTNINLNLHYHPLVMLEYLDFHIYTVKSKQQWTKSVSPLFWLDVGVKALQRRFFFLLGWQLQGFTTHAIRITNKGFACITQNHSQQARATFSPCKAKLTLHHCTGAVNQQEQWRAAQSHRPAPSSI